MDTQQAANAVAHTASEKLERPAITWRRLLIWSSTVIAMLAYIISALLAGSDLVAGKIYNTRFDGTTWDDTNWRIQTTKLEQGHYQQRMSISNGYIGINVAAVGPFFEVDLPVDGDDINGWPLYDL
jgi:hypothetical protein